MAADPTPDEPVRARLRRRPGHRDRRRLDRETRPDYPRPARHLAPRHQWWYPRSGWEPVRPDVLTRARRFHRPTGAGPQLAPDQRRPRPTTGDARTRHPPRPALRVPRLPRRRPRLRPRPHRPLPAARRGRTTRTDPPRRPGLPVQTTPPAENLHRLDLPPHHPRPVPVDQPARTHLPHLAPASPVPTAERAVPSNTPTHQHTGTPPGQTLARAGHSHVQNRRA